MSFRTRPEPRPFDRLSPDVPKPNLHAGSGTQRRLDRGIAAASDCPRQFTGKEAMLATIAVILLVMWALGMVGGYAAGGLLHILLVAAVVVVVLRVVQGRRVV